MDKKIIMLAAACMSAVSAISAPITPEQALTRAYADGPAKANSIMKADLHLVHTRILNNGTASAYIFNRVGGKGFAILSADDCMVPVIGYSATGSIDPSNLPPSFVYWLDECGRQMQWAVSRNIHAKYAKPYAPAEWSPIAPLMSTTWNQDTPYNNETPVLNGKQAPTGCVATSFAQVMNYFKYPEKGRGSIRYTDTSGDIRSLVFSRKSFDWDNMLDNYSGNYNETQADAVAYLMKACGYSVEMGYGVNASGAQSYKLANAAVTYFDYDKNIRYYDRSLFSAEEWATMIYENIKNVGPIIYDGSSIDGGHSFVCDGYDGNGYFHFNWGWGGVSDGYYVLDSLNPESQGIGGADGGFNYSQSALFGMQPPTGDPIVPDYDNMKIFGSAVASLSGNVITFGAIDSNNPGWGNASYRDITVQVGAILQKDDENETIVAEISGGMTGSGNLPTTLSATSYYPTSRSNPEITLPTGLADGRYKVVIATKQISNGEDTPWQPIVKDWGNANYCYLTVNGSEYAVENAAALRLDFDISEFDSPLYLNRNALLVTAISNNTDSQLTTCFSPVLYRDGKIQYQGDMMLVTVDPGQTIEKKALVAFYAAAGATSTGAGKYTLKILDRESGNIIGSYGDYEMTYIASGFSLSLDDLSVPGATIQNVTSGTREFKDVYYCPTTDMDLFFAYSVKEGYFDSSIRVFSAEYDPDSNKFNASQENLYYDTPFLGQGEEAKVEIPLAIADIKANAIYRINASYILNGQNRPLGSIYVSFGMSGIDDIQSDMNIIDYEYYNLQGMKVNNPEKGQILIRKSKDKVEKILF
mgnify:CR=1 FL=1